MLFPCRHSFHGSESRAWFIEGEMQKKDVILGYRQVSPMWLVVAMHIDWYPQVPAPTA
jgi:hypothetical protein